MLELRNVTKKYKNHFAIRDLSFSVNSGDIVGLLGSNGAGKSTCISMIATLQKPDSGEILFYGKDIRKYPYIIRERLGYVPQDNILYENLSGFENLLFWGRSYHIRNERLKLEIKRVCDIIGFDKGLLSKKVGRYSGGMKKRLNLGVALLHHPELILLDEPTAGIDIQSANRIIEAVKLLRDDKTAMIYVGHDIQEAEVLCNRVCILHEGKLKIDCRVGTDAGCRPLKELYLEHIQD